ncbi:hypothetical protein XENOCAPTIV_010871, partial [Xenoophorus captivus]
LYSRQPDETSRHAFRGEPRRSHHPPQPLPQPPLALGQHARLQLGEDDHHRSRNGTPATDSRRAARHQGGSAGRHNGISGSLQRQRRLVQWRKAGQEDKKCSNRL